MHRGKCSCLLSSWKLFYRRTVLPWLRFGHRMLQISQTRQLKFCPSWFVQHCVEQISSLDLHQIKVNGQKLQTVTSFKYPGSVMNVEGSKPEILSRIAQTTAALTKLKPVWSDRSISLSSKIRPMRSLVTSILQWRIQAMEMRCYRRILRISYKDSVAKEEVRAKIQRAKEPHEDLLIIVKRRKLQWYGYVFHSSDLAKTILQGTVNGGRRQGRQRKRREDNIMEWTGPEFAKSQRAVENTEEWRKLGVKSSVASQQPLRLRSR